MNPDLSVPPATSPIEPLQPSVQPLAQQAQPTPEYNYQAVPNPNPLSSPMPPPNQAGALPMFSPMTPPTPGQPAAQPMQPQYPPQPAGYSGGGYTPVAAPQMPKPNSKKKLFIIFGAVLGLILLAGGFFFFISNSSLVGSLSPDSFKGLNYKRPASWEKDTSESTMVAYYPKKSIGKGSNGKPTYALEMMVNADEGVFGSAPSALDTQSKSALQKVIDRSISEASLEILPVKSEVGCDDEPAFKDKPKKIAVPGNFLAISYSFTCKASAGNGSQVFYYSVVDLVPNDKDVEYVLLVGAASEQIYKTNLTKINEILNSATF